MKVLALFISTLLFMVNTAFTQTIQNKLSPDTLVIDSIMDRAYELEFTYPDSAIALYALADSLAGNIGDWLRKGRAHNYRAIVYFELGMFEDALIHNQRAEELYESVGYKTGIAAIKNNKGNIKLYSGEFSEAVKLYHEGISIYEILGDTMRLVYSYLNTGTLFHRNGYQKEALDYYHSALNLAPALNDKTILADLHMNIGNTKLHMNDSSGFLKNLETAVYYATASGHLFGRVHIYNSLLRYFNHTEQADSAMKYISEALIAAEMYGNPFNIAEVYNTVGRTYLNIGKTESALNLLNSSRDISASNNYLELLAESTLILSEAYAMKNDYISAYSYLSEYKTLADTLFSLEKQRELHEVDRKYQLLKKENQIALHLFSLELKEKEIQRKNIIIISSLLLMMLTLLTLLLLVKLHRKKNALAEGELVRVHSEREKQIIRAILDGEEKERSRIARELHDSVNGNLAALKLNLGEFTNGDYAIMIDRTMDEIRTLSHNLMPDVVRQFGLNEALGQFFNSLKSGSSVQIEYQCVGDDKKLSREVAMNVYRIIQELTANSLKHSGGSEIFVQLIIDEDNLSIAVEDNGKGFDVHKIMKEPRVNQGIGLSGMESRVNLLRGSFDIHSTTHSGTGIHIEIPLTVNESA